MTSTLSPLIHLIDDDEAVRAGLALLIGFDVVLGVNHELIGSHTQVSARPVNLPTFSDHKQPARLARVGLPGVIERQGLVLRQHQRISPAAGKPPKGNSALCPNRALHDDRRLPQTSRLLEPTVWSLASR